MDSSLRAVVAREKQDRRKMALIRALLFGVYSDALPLGSVRLSCIDPRRAADQPDAPVFLGPEVSRSVNLQH